MTEPLERIDVVEGQVPLPLMPDERSIFRLRPVRRPDGRFYRPRLVPKALLLGFDDGVTGVAVMRTHDVDWARRIAMRALFEDDPAATWFLNVPELRWGRWRPDRDIDGQTWVGSLDGSSGTPAVFFEVETEPW